MACHLNELDATQTSTSLTQLLSYDFLLNHKNFYYIYMYEHSVLIVKKSISSDFKFEFVR